MIPKAVKKITPGRTFKPPKPKKSPAAKPPKPVKAPPVDPVTRDVTAQFKPAYDALERQRQQAQAERDAATRDRAAFDTWAQADRERRLAYLQGEFAKSAESVAAQRKSSDALISGAIESAMTRIGGLGGTALQAAGVGDAVAGVKTGQSIADVEARRASEQAAAYRTRATDQSLVDRAYGDTMTAKALQAYNRRLAELDNAQLGLEQNKVKATTEGRAALAKAEADAVDKLWQRNYLLGKQTTAAEIAKAKLEVQQRGQDITARGQDLTAQTADANRLSRENIAAARLGPATTGYKGRSPEAYTKLRDSWGKRLADSIKLNPDNTNPANNPAYRHQTALQQMKLMYQAGVRPSDIVRTMEAVDGNLISVDEYRSFLLGYLPPKNVATLMRDLFNVPIAPDRPKTTTPPDRLPGANKKPKYVIKRGPLGTKLKYIVGADGKLTFVGAVGK